MLYRELPRQFCGGLVGLNSLCGSLGIMVTSKLCSYFNTPKTINFAYGIGAIFILAYLISYLVVIIFRGHSSKNINK